MTKAASAAIAGLGLLMLVGNAAAQSSNSEPAQLAALKAEIEELRGVLPTQAHVMVDVDYHFSNLWFAARNGNWPLASFYLNETKGRLDWALRLRPARKLSSGQDLPLAPFIKNMEQSSLMQLKTAIANRDRKEFAAGYRQALAECYACHTAIEKPFLRPQIPASPATHIIGLQP